MHNDELPETFSPLTMWDTIEAFHTKYGINFPISPRPLTREEWKFRVEFMQEELDEYIDAKTPSDAIDALVDLVVVAMGTAYMQGFKWDKHWEEVFEANMRKVRASSAADSERGTQLDIVKPEGWVGPNHDRLFLDNY